MTVDNQHHRNYQQDLNNLIDYLEPVLKKVWEANKDERVIGMWGKLLSGPFAEFKTIFDIVKAKKFSLLPVMYTGPLAGVIGWFGWDADAFIQYFGYDYANGFLIGAIFLVWYIATAILHFFEMANLDSPHFHIGAFARLRKAEFEAFKPFIHGEQRFSFVGLKDWLYDPARVGSSVLEYIEKEKEWIKKREEYDSGIKALQAEFMALQQSKNAQIEELELKITFAFRLLQKVKTNLSRFTNGELTQNDLEFICPYTIYKLEGDVLVKKADVGTSGNGKTINIHEKKDYSCVIVLDHLEEFYYGRLGADRSVFSYRMTMPDGSIWVVNFHINENDNQIMEIFFGNGIIDTQTLFDLVFVHCKLLYFYNGKKEVSA